MKTLLLAIVIIALLPLNVFSQKPDYECVTMEKHEKMKKEIPGYTERELQLETFVQSWIKNNKKKIQTQSDLGVITIPVVVHIIWNTPDQNFTDLEVQRQIDDCNRDFSGQNSNPMVSFANMGFKDNTNIQFCLAQVAPDGSPTSGIERRYTDIVEFPRTNDMKFWDKGGLDAWDPNLYLNIWVANTEGLACWAQFPSTVDETYGVFMSFERFARAPLPTGRDWSCITTHEIGHCFNLRHIWADDQNSTSGTCSGTDYVFDTPNQAVYTYGFQDSELTDACSPSSPGIMWMNFMDYTADSCLANFTPGQSERMQACFVDGGPLYYLANSTMCNPNACHYPTSLDAWALKKASAILKWTDMVDVLGYNVRYRKVGSNNWTEIFTNTNVKYIDGLSRTTSYEFQVQSICASGLSDYSYKYSFTTPSRDPNGFRISAPTLSTPINGAINISLDPRLEWNTVTYATGYIIYYSTSYNFSNAIEANTSDSFLDLAVLQENTTYYWKVLAFAQQNSSKWSSTFSFTTLSNTFDPPTLLTPTNNATNVVINPTLQWTSVNGAEDYLIEVTDASNIKTQYTSNTNSYNLSNLNYDTQYSWKVKARKSTAPTETDWSTSWLFTTETYTVTLDAPTLVSPADASRGVAITVALSWNAVSGATHYTLEYSTSDTFTNPITHGQITNTSYTISGLDLRKNYWWRVKAHNATLSSDWSSPYKFRTAVKIKIAVYNNDSENMISVKTFPNPFSSNTNIEINIKENAEVKLTIHDILAREILTILNKELIAGTHLINFDASMLKPGIYYCRLTTKNDFRIVQMQVIK